MRRIRAPALLLLVFVLATACTGGGSPRPTSRPPGADVPRGGTLRIRFLLNPPGFDPAIYGFSDWELFRCCLARTLLSYNGRPTEEGGAELHPDLATAPPDVSEDGLAWTFHLKSGLRYGPPFQGSEIVASDIIRALKREADPDAAPGLPHYAFYYSVILGFDDFAAGKTSSISGLQAPDDQTLKVSLTQPTGDLGYRLSLPAAAPITARAAIGHDGDYGRFLVSSGPYMFDGSGHLDFSPPAKKQTPVSGNTPSVFNEKQHYAIGGSATLVRNPSWDPQSDALRGAYADRIEIDLGPPGKVGFIDAPTYVGTELPSQMQRALESIRRSELDLVPDVPPPSDQLDRFLSDKGLSTLAHLNQKVAVDYIAMNVAAPPFDDIHVRKAFYLALDRVSLKRASRGLPVPVYGEIPNHIVPDAMEDALLVATRPRWVPPDTSHNLAAARAEMRRSRYDRNGDGTCDSTVCADVGLISDDQWPKEFSAPVRASAAAIGITLTFHRFDRETEYPEQERPQHRWPLNANGWLADYPNGSNFIPFLFDGATLDDPQTFNSSVLGATPEQLERWGYPTKHVRSVDGRIDQCDALIGHAQVECWASLDKYLMDEVVPWVPFLFEQTAQVVSPRVEHYEIDQFVGYPAFDQIALEPGSS